jgi:hypothetical protein
MHFLPDGGLSRIPSSLHFRPIPHCDILAAAPLNGLLRATHEPIYRLVSP